ncbi:MAG: hypothetical protein AAGJ74_06150 [Pseudomonadota bacterium]
MTERDPLDAFFDEARANRPTPGADLMARVLADADAVADGREARATRAATPARRRPAQMLKALGGWPALAGLAATTATGLWIGFALPELPTSLGLASGYDLSDLAPGYGSLSAFGG